MTYDVIRKVTKGKIILRYADGLVNCKEVILELVDDGMGLNWVKAVDKSSGRVSNKHFITGFLANRYFDNIVDKYNLKEVEINE